MGLSPKHESLLGAGILLQSMRQRLGIRRAGDCDRAGAGRSDRLMDVATVVAAGSASRSRSGSEAVSMIIASGATGVAVMVRIVDAADKTPDASVLATSTSLSITCAITSGDERWLPAWTAIALAFAGIAARMLLL
jgi:hypothetical protein